MTFIDGIILGIIQGFTEFLPISSSGHLVLVQEILGLELPGNDFEILFKDYKKSLIYIDTVYNPIQTKMIKHLKK